MNVTYDEQHDRIYLRVGDGRQTRDGGYTQPVYVSPDEDDPSREPGVMVQLGFEQPLPAPLYLRRAGVARVP